MHISLCICNFGNKLSNIGQVFSDNHWEYGLYFDIATSPVLNEHSFILYCIMINQQAVLNINSRWIICRNSYSTRTLYMFNYISFIDYFTDNLCLVVIDFSANTDTKGSTDIYYCFCELYILCCKWMCWNLMWVELCGNYFLLFLLSM